MEFKKHLDKGKEGANKLFDSVGKKAGEFTDSTGKLYKESGAKEKVDKFTGATSNQLDVISGQKMYALVQEKMELQNKINDVLAYKLQEALKRIDELEGKLNS